MISRMMEFVLPRIIGIVGHKQESLTNKEQLAQECFMNKLQVKKCKTKKPVIMAIVGLIGSGKSTVAKKLANLLGATVIEGDEIRIELRKQSERYEGARKITENAAIEVIKQGGNVILDSDHIDQKKRASIRQIAKTAGAHLVFIRTYCDLDVMVGRIITATYHDKSENFFGGALSKWKGSEQSKGAAVKVREMWRRTPHHYRWINKIGGKWILKKLPFTIFAEIDTTDPEQMKLEINRCAKKLLAL